MKRQFAFVVWLSIVFPLLAVAEPKPSASGEYALSDFGDVSTAATAQTTLQTACEWIIAHGGGVLIVPPTAPAPLVVQNTYQHDRESGPTVTIRDLRKGYETRYLPAVGTINADGSGWAGEQVNHLINMPGHGLPFQGAHYMSGMHNAVVRGAASYMQMISRPAAKGKDSRIDVPSIRGIFVGEYLTLTGQPASYAEPFDRIWVKGIGWDPKEQVNYVIADLEHDHPAGAILYNKHVTGSVNIDATANCDNQTMEFQVTRRQYAHGDSFLISGKYEYQGDVFSGLGDERGVVLNAEVTTDPETFHAVVEKMDDKGNAITIKPGVCAIQKLATSRPIINLNPKKAITAGSVKIVPPDDFSGFTVPNKAYDPVRLATEGLDVKSFRFTWQDHGTNQPSLVDAWGQPVRQFKYAYHGRAYPSIIVQWVNTLGGCIIGSADCGWTEAVVGRFFAVDDPGEVLSPDDGSQGQFYAGNFSRPVRRWYLIKKFWKNADGTCTIKIERIRWAASDAGAPNLYNFGNYTWDGHERPLKYIIAPGAYAYDIGDCWKDTSSGEVGPADPRTLRVVPNGDRGTPFDFAAGDPIEQAIGADPAVPVPVRVRCFNGIPDTLEAGAIDLENLGKLGMHSGMAVTGGCNNRDDLRTRKDHRPPWITALDVSSVTEDTVVFGGDVTDAALLFKQINNHEQPIKWKHAKGETTLVVDPATAEMKITGSDVSLPSVKGVSGVSGSAVAAHNLRGIDVAVPSGATRVTVKFPVAEADARYSIHVQPSWNTTEWTVSKTADGFVVQFGQAAPAGARIDWQLLR